jgi:NTP-dependent ternary system trypsin peptidase co-occuring protein
MRFVCGLAVALSFLAGCATAPPKPVPGPPLDSVLKEVQRGLQKAQDALAASSLPQLKSVQLALHTQVQKDATGKIAILVVSVGGGEGASTSQDLALTLTPPKPNLMRPLTHAQATVADSIVELIQEAAQTAENAKKGPFPLEAEKLTLEFAFTVTSSLDGGLKFSLGSMSADVGGSVKNAAQQKVTITFSTTRD